MKLTKTQQKLINRADPRGVVCVTHAWGTGSQGGKINSGSREHAAALKLVAMGVLAKVEDGERFPYRHTVAGRTVFIRNDVYKLV